MRIAPRTLLITALLASPAGLLAACGGDDTADRPKDAYVRLQDAQSFEVVGPDRIVSKAPVTVTWKAHGKAQNGKATEIQIVNYLGDCDLPQSEPCGTAPKEIGKVRQPLPQDGTDATGNISMGVVKPGTRRVVRVQLCSGDACWATNRRSYRRLPAAG